MNWLFRIKPEKVAADLLYEARRALVEHEAHAEFHAAMAAMYRKRIERIDPRETARSAAKPSSIERAAAAMYDPLRNVAAPYFSNPESSK